MISQHVVPPSAGTHQPPTLAVYRRRLPDRLIERPRRMVPASPGTTPGKSAGTSNLAGEVLLHSVGYIDQPPPRPLEERHHAIHVAVARQRNFDLALALGHLRLRLFQRVRLRQRLVDLAGDGWLAN